MIEMVTPRSRSSGSTYQENKTQIKGYELGWKAKSRIYCKGKLLTGPLNVHILPVITVVSVACYGLYIARTYVTPALEIKNSEYVFRLVELLVLVLSYHFWKAAFTDPGVLLRHSQYEHARISISEEDMNQKDQHLSREIPEVY